MEICSNLRISIWAGLKSVLPTGQSGLTAPRPHTLWGLKAPSSLSGNYFVVNLLTSHLFGNMHH